MNRHILPLLVLALGISAGAAAQTKEKAPSKERSKEESFTIRKKGDSKEKTTIVIDGDNITVNGKPLSELKDSDVEVLRNKSFAPMMRMRADMAPMGGMKMFGEGFPFSNNKAVLGVTSEKDAKGARIRSVEKESAAEKAGLKEGDIITKVGDSKIENSDDLYEAIGTHDPEEKVTITYLRDDKEAQATATLGKGRSGTRSFSFNSDDFKDFEKDFKQNFDLKEFRMPPGGSWDGEGPVYTRKPRLGLGIQDLSDGKGVKVIDVDDASAAEKAGMKKDDLITEVDGKVVNSVDAFKNHIRELKEGDSIKLTYQRSGKTQTTTISFPKKLKTAEL